MSRERLAIASTLASSTLTSPAKKLDYDPVAMMPDVRVIKIGGKSIMDRGRAAVFAVLDELVALKNQYKMLLCCGGGT
jgi:molybdenum storage protein